MLKKFLQRLSDANLITWPSKYLFWALSVGMFGMLDMTGSRCVIAESLTNLTRIGEPNFVDWGEDQKNNSSIL